MMDVPIHALLWTEIERLLTTITWSKDEELTQRRHLRNNLLEVYQLADGRVLDFIPYQSGRIYKSREIYIAMIFEHRSQREFMEIPIHEQEGFVDAIPSLIQQLPGLLNLLPQDLNFSMRSLSVVEEAVNRIGRHEGMRGILFSALVAYVGEVIRTDKSCQWVMTQQNGIWSPTLETEDGLSYYAPTIIVFDTFELITEDLVLKHSVWRYKKLPPRLSSSDTTGIVIRTEPKN